MHKIDDNLELPETEEELSYIEVAGGIGKLLHDYFDVIEEDNAARKRIAMRLSEWLLIHWRMLHRAGLFNVYMSHDILGDKHYAFAMGAENQMSVSFQYPTPENETERTKEIAEALMSIGRIVGIQDV
tara:strand:- start:549 stop:932 length:384 start_codon:yes stop_codon:yes gene_type:complete